MINLLIKIKQVIRINSNQTNSKLNGYYGKGHRIWPKFYTTVIDRLKCEKYLNQTEISRFTIFHLSDLNFIRYVLHLKR